MLISKAAVESVAEMEYQSQQQFYKAVLAKHSDLPQALKEKWQKAIETPFRMAPEAEQMASREFARMVCVVAVGSAQEGTYALMDGV